MWVNTGHLTQQQLSLSPAPPIVTLGTLGNYSHRSSHGDSMEYLFMLGTVPGAHQVHGHSLL